MASSDPRLRLTEADTHFLNSVVGRGSLKIPGSAWDKLFAAQYASIASLFSLVQANNEGVTLGQSALLAMNNEALRQANDALRIMNEAIAEIRIANEKGEP